MFVDLTPEQRKLQAELREYFSNLISPDEAEAMRSDRHNEAYRAVIRRMGADGKLGVGWPKEFGGLGFGPIEQQIFVNEAQRADIPLPAVTLQTGGPTLQAYGSAEQKKKFLPAILAGEVHFAIGYTEPEAGTDLASLRTTAVRDGDEYIVNGQKVFTTGAHDADYIWLAARTDPAAVKHKGISILIVDTKDPGYSWTPMILSDGAHHTNATYYNDVRVPADMLVGEENGGWRLITTQLNNERVMLGPAGRFGAIPSFLFGAPPAAAAAALRKWEAMANGEDGAPKGRELEVAGLLRAIKQAGIKNVVWLTADVHYTAAHYYDPAKAQFSDFSPFWEFVSGPLNAGGFGPNKTDATFGMQVMYQKAPTEVNAPPSSGLQFFGQVDIDARTRAMTVTLKDLAGASLYSKTLAPQRA